MMTRPVPLDIEHHQVRRHARLVWFLIGVAVGVVGSISMRMLG